MKRFAVLLLTLAMQNTRLIALSGLITGIAATLSMASSEYLSSKSEGRPDAFKSATYTGISCGRQRLTDICGSLISGK